MMQDQSSKARKSLIPNGFPTFISKPQDQKDPNNSEITKFSTMDSVPSDFPLCAPSCEMELDEEEDTIPWMNFPIVEPFNDESCSGFLPESGVAGNETSLVLSMERRSNSHHVNELARPSSAADAPSIQQDSVSKVLSSVTQLNKLKIGDKSPVTQSQYSLPRPGNSEFTHSDASNANRMDLRKSVGGSMGSKLHKLDAGQPSSSSGLMNFPYFSRLASLSGLNVRNTATTTGAVIRGKQRACSKNSGGTISSRNPMEPTLVDSSHQETISHVKLSMPPTAGSVESVNSEPDSLPLQQAEPLSVKAGNNEKSLDTAPTTIMVCDEKIPEPVVATSSLCSGNRLEIASNDPAYSLRREFHETGDSEGPSDEAEEESVDDRKIASRHTGFKRGRAAQVHNLSERRRRERINEKMRALQELIPSGNKADKASMLDEAIEYLRTLQLHVQILSMGTGMYMPPMMLPAAMQQMHQALMPQFSPMGIGMGMHDVNYSMTSMPNIQAPCYPVPGPPFSTTSAFPGGVGYSHQFLGHPGQELLMSMPPVPPPQSPLFGTPPMRLPVGNVSAMPGTVDLPLCAPSAGSKEMIQNVSSQKTLNDQAKSSMFEDSDQATAVLNDQYRDADAAQNHGSTKRRRLARE